MIKDTVEKVTEIPETSLEDVEKVLGQRIHYRFDPIVNDLYSMTVNEIPKERERVKRAERMFYGMY